MMFAKEEEYYPKSLILSSVIVNRNMFNEDTPIIDKIEMTGYIKLSLPSLVLFKLRCGIPLEYI